MKTPNNHSYNLTGSEPIIMCSPVLVNFSLPSLTKRVAEVNPLAGKGAELELDRRLSADAEAESRAGVGAGPSEGEGWLSVENIDHFYGKVSNATTPPSPPRVPTPALELVIVLDFTLASPSSSL